MRGKKPRLTPNQVAEVMESSEPYKHFAKKFGIHPSTLSKTMAKAAQHGLKLWDRKYNGDKL